MLDREHTDSGPNSVNGCRVLKCQSTSEAVGTNAQLPVREHATAPV